MPDSIEPLPLFSTVRPPIPTSAHEPLLGASRSGSFIEIVRQFEAFGTRSIEEIVGGIPYLVNEFWTARQRQAHSVHEISYRACFKPQLPGFFIGNLTSPGDVVYDPFMGRGTTPVEAALMGRRPAGNDINPLSVLLTRPRLRRVTLSDIVRVLSIVDWHGGDFDEPDLLAFYSECTLRQISALRRWLLYHAPLDQIPPAAVDWVRMVALNRLTGHSPGFFSVYTLPPNQAVSAQAQRKINEKRQQIPPDRDVAKIILKKTKSLLSDGSPPAESEYMLTTAVASQTQSITTASVALVVTSPPFLDIVQYADDNWLRCWFAGIDVRNVAIAQHRTEAGWQSMVRDTLTELARVVRPGGHVAFEVGEVRNGRILLERLVWQAAEGLPFDRLFVMVNQQEFTKTANCWGVQNNSNGTNTNRIVLLRRRFE
jgi:DNA methylase